MLQQYPANNFYPPKFRLHHSWEYKKILSANSRKRFAPIVVYTIKNEQGYPRLGITVRGAPNSVFRNKFKRMTREIFRNKKNHLDARDFNVVISISKNLQNTQDLKKNLGIFREQIQKEISHFILPS